MGAFEKTFSTPVEFPDRDSHWGIIGTLTKKEAALRISTYLQTVDIKKSKTHIYNYLRKEWVAHRRGICDWSGESLNRWWLADEEDHNAKEIWYYD